MVSVIIPNYNHEVYLKQRIESVLNQTWKDFEVIILDDCSTDNSRDIIEQFRIHPQVTSIAYNEINSGSTFAQWSKGIALSKGAFIWIAESDDWCESSFLENILKGIMQDDLCVLGYCQSYCISDSNIIKWKSEYPSLAEHLDGQEFIKRYMLPDTALFNASMVVWRKTAFEGVSNEYKNYRYCGDWLFWIEICRQGSVFASGKLLNYFREHDKNVSGKAVRIGDSFIEELTMFQSLYKKNWIDYHDFLRCLRREYVHYKAVEKTFTPERQKQIQKIFFAEPGVKSFLKLDYRKFYFSYAIKKIIKKLIAN